MPRQTKESPERRQQQQQARGSRRAAPLTESSSQTDPPSSPRESTGSVMSRDRLPMIGSAGSKPTGKPILTTLLAHQQPPQARRRKRAPSSQQPCATLPDTMTPWGGQSLSESSFTSIPPPPPPPPPIPPPTPSSPPAPGLPRYPARLRSPAPSPLASTPQERAPRVGRARRRVLPPKRAPRAPRLPPLRPVTNLSFSRSFTFSFFELPLHQAPRCRAERIRDLMVLLRQIQY